jgi:hypothetical protein
MFLRPHRLTVSQARRVMSAFGGVPGTGCTSSCNAVEPPSLESAWFPTLEALHTCDFLVSKFACTDSHSTCAASNAACTATPRARATRRRRGDARAAHRPRRYPLAVRLPSGILAAEGVVGLTRAVPRREPHGVGGIPVKSS